MKKDTVKISESALKWSFAAVCALLWVMAPEKAHAWGPVTHLQVGLEALRNLDLLGHSLRMVLQSFPYHYLYGCIGADMIFAKGLAKVHEHSHNWSVAFEVLREASSPPQEAFAYGYLTHLASDIIAHNYFIPESVVKSYTTKTFRHLYWEVRFDALARRELWDLSREIVELPQHDEDDQLLEKVVKRTLFSFKTDKRIFSSLVALNRIDRWQRMLRVHAKLSVWKISDQDAAKYRTLSYQAALDFLIHQENATCLQMDPIGKNALMAAKWIRQNLGMLQRRGKLEPVLYAQALEALQPGGELSFASTSLT